MPLTLRWTGSTRLPVDGASLRPETLRTLSPGEIARNTLPVGNGSAKLGDLFALTGDPSDGGLIFEGDLRHVRRIGLGLTSGAIEIRGDAGSGVGQGMLGGTIDVLGSVADSAGAAMRGGFLRIRGSAGHNLGGSEPGARLGMRDGVILVDGDIGHDAGLAMRRGLIAVSGSCGDGLGRGLIAGSIFAFGRVGTGAGAGMKRGTLALFGPSPRLLPTFAPSGRDRPPFLTVYLRTLRAWGFPVPDPAFSVPVLRYNGDRAERGQGEILVRDGT